MNRERGRKDRDGTIERGEDGPALGGHPSHDFTFTLFIP